MNDSPRRARNTGAVATASALLGLFVVCLPLLVTVDSGCALRGRCEPDEINEYGEAALVPPTGQIKDNLNAICDKVDWRYISHFVDSTATVTVRVGDPFKGHEMVGVVSMFDSDAQLLQQAEIRANEHRYEFKLPVVARSQYYLKVESTDGQAPYSVEVTYRERDPCEMCPECTECIDKKCVPIPCCGRCPRHLCDAETNQCREPEPQPECARKRDCRRGERCTNGRCVKSKGTGGGKTPRKDPTPPIVTKKKECSRDEDCPKGKECVDGKCKDAVKPADTGPGVAYGRITEALDGSGGVVLRIAVKARHGVRSGDRGCTQSKPKVCFTVKKVGGRRIEGKATGISSKSDLPKGRKVKINLSKEKE